MIAAVPAPVLRLASRTPVHANDDVIELDSPAGRVVLRGKAARWLEPCVAGATLEALERRFLETSHPILLGELYMQLVALQQLGALAYDLVVDTQRLLSITTVDDALFAVAALPPDAPLRLSRFAILRSADGVLVAESAATPCTVAIREPEIVASLSRFAGPRALGNAPAPVVAAAAFLAAAGVLVIDTGASDCESPLDVWEPHDLWLHKRSRRGAHADPIGATFPFYGVTEPSPALPRPRSGPRTKLAIPERTSAGHEHTLFDAMETRSSKRSYGRIPMAITQLSELLFRVARVRTTAPIDPERGRFYETSSRPYPNGGGAYELELYITAANCTGLERGCYHYDAASHELVGLGAPEESIAALLADASAATAGEASPQVLISITSRFRRLAWKYRGIAYATTLKNVGVLYQSLYLVATAMGLAPCGLGSGDALLVERAFGLDRFGECSVGEVILGSAPARDV